MEINSRDKAILIGLYLSKFDTDGLKHLDFSSFIEAFNTLGYAIGVKPASLKNYRDEFDPLFPNSRKGWHKRKIRSYCRDFYDQYKNLTLTDFTEFIKGVVYANYEIEVLVEKATRQEKKEETFAKRLITGQAAEQYFKDIYNQIPDFKNLILEDTTKLGCGFDFKLYSNLNHKLIGVEVKGLNGSSGSIALTEKEFKIASYLKQDYYLFVVKDFIKKPNHIYFKNPVNSDLKFKKLKRQLFK